MPLPKPENNVCKRGPASNNSEQKNIKKMHLRKDGELCTKDRTGVLCEYQYLKIQKFGLKRQLGALKFSETFPSFFSYFFRTHRSRFSISRLKASETERLISRQR